MTRKLLRALSFASVLVMGTDLVHRLAKKKGAVLIVLQNSTELPIALLTGSLTSGKPEKSAPMPNLIPALSQHEVGFYNPEGQWTFGVQGDSTYKTRLTLLHSAEHANLERLPAACHWSVDLQQNWKSAVPLILLTFTIKDATANAEPTSPKSSPKYEKTESGDAAPASGKLKGKRSGKDGSDAKGKKDHGDDEGSIKRKKSSRKSKEPTTSAEAPAPAEEEAPVTAFQAPTTSAFGIDAIMGDGFSSDEEGDGHHGSTWGKKFEIKQRAGDAAPETMGDNESLRRASSLFTLQGSASKPLSRPDSSAAAPVSSNTAADEDFFVDLDRTRSGRHLSIPTAEDRERKLSQIPPAAQLEFDSAMKKLNGGLIAEANAALTAALSQLNELAFKNNVAVATQWCIYAQLTGLLVEMQRLTAEKLFAQRALLARFVGLLGLRLENQAHALICLRMAINRNMEMENFRTAGQLLQSFATMTGLTELDRQNVPKKLDICAAHNYGEAFIPTGSSLDPVSGQFLLNGYSYALCHKQMVLIRDPTHHVCRYCDATFSEQASPDRKCYFCDSTLETQS